jgi:hypothetical protein
MIKIWSLYNIFKEISHVMKQLKSTLHLLEKRLTAFSQAVLALVIDLRWSNATLTLILNETDEIQRNRLLEIWVQHRFADLERINITVSPIRLRTQLCNALLTYQKGVLVAGVISSAFSWYNITSSPWSTRAIWYCGLLFALAAITTAGVHSAGLHRLGCHPEWHAKLQQTLGVSVDAPMFSGEGGWRPRMLQPVLWQTPGFLLKLSITCFLVGLLILIWDAAKRSGIGLMSDDMKVGASAQGSKSHADDPSDRDTLHGWCGNLSCIIHHVRT